MCSRSRPVRITIWDSWLKTWNRSIFILSFYLCSPCFGHRLQNKGLQAKDESGVCAPHYPRQQIAWHDPHIQLKIQLVANEHPGSVDVLLRAKWLDMMGYSYMLWDTQLVAMGVGKPQRNRLLASLGYYPRGPELQGASNKRRPRQHASPKTPRCLSLTAGCASCGDVIFSCSRARVARCFL